jgi:hypothetical protein
MPRRDVLDDAPSHHLISHFASCPLAARALFGLFAGQGEELARLLSSYPSGRARPRQISEALTQRQISERDRLQFQPAPPPCSHCVHAYLQLASNLAVVFSVRCRQDYASAQRVLLGSGVAAHQGFQFVVLCLTQAQGFRFRSSHCQILLLSISNERKASVSTDQPIS